MLGGDGTSEDVMAAPEADSTTPATISVIIPTLNEESNIGRSITRLEQADIHEIIVADGDSDDRTAEIAESRGATLVRSERGRGRKLNAGAAAASGDTLLFLHADTSLPARFEAQVRAILEKPGVAAGAFGLRIDGARRAYRLIEKSVSWRSRVLGWPYGDQGLFLRTETFHRAGAFPEIPAMEDFELVRRLRRLGRIEIAPCEVVTAARRWSRRGIWRTTVLNNACVAAYLLGVSPDRIARWRSK